MLQIMVALFLLPLGLIRAADISSELSPQESNLLNSRVVEVLHQWNGQTQTTSAVVLKEGIILTTVALNESATRLVQGHQPVSTTTTNTRLLLLFVPSIGKGLGWIEMGSVSPQTNELCFHYIADGNKSIRRSHGSRHMDQNSIMVVSIERAAQLAGTGVFAHEWNGITVMMGFGLGARLSEKDLARAMAGNLTLEEILTVDVANVMPINKVRDDLVALGLNPPPLRNLSLL